MNLLKKYGGHKMSKKSIVEIRFKGSNKGYTYITDLDLKPEDKVIVDSPSEGMVVVDVIKVRGLTKNQLNVACKWVVQKVDLVAYDANMKKQEIVQEIRNQLDERKNDMQEMLIYQQLAASDPGIQSLLDELEKIDPDMVPQLTAPKASKASKAPAAIVSGDEEAK